MSRLWNELGKIVHLGEMSFTLLGLLIHGRDRCKLLRQTANAHPGMSIDVTCRGRAEGHDESKMDWQLVSDCGPPDRGGNGVGRGY